MKRVIYAFIISLLASTMAYSQLSLRPQVGINFPSFSEALPENGEFSSEVGFQFGADLQIGGSFYFQPGINWETSKLSTDNAGEMKISNINVPVMVGFKLFENEESRAFGLRIFAGPNFAFNVNKDLDESLTDIEEDDIKDFQLSGIAGAGVDLWIIFVDLGYKFGLSDFFDADHLDGRVSYFIANAGIRLGF